MVTLCRTLGTLLSERDGGVESAHLVPSQNMVLVICLSALWAALSLAAGSLSCSSERTERVEILILPALLLLFLSKKKTDQDNS